MCITHQVLALIPLFVAVVHSFSWDVVVGAQHKLEFYNNGTISHVESFHNDLYIGNVAYDAVHNRLIIVNRNLTQEFWILSYNIATKEKQGLVRRSLDKMFHEFSYSFAYDPVMEIIFWTDVEAIYWFSLKPGSINNVHGNVLWKFDDSIPWSVAVDSCRGFVYWSNVVDRGTTTIEKGRFDGSEREIILNDNMRAVRNLVIDQQTQKLYWTDDVRAHRPAKVSEFTIQSADLNGENRKTFYVDSERNQPTAIAVSKDSIYWVPSFEMSDKIWYLPKNPLGDTKPETFTVSGWYSGSIAANYKIEDQIRDIEDCEPLRNLLPKNKVIKE